MRTSSWVGPVLAMCMAACGSNNNTNSGTDSGTAVDVPTATDGIMVGDTGVATDAGTSPAGQPCDPTADGGGCADSFTCYDNVAVGVCMESGCTNYSVQTMERAECGGAGSTCLQTPFETGANQTTGTNFCVRSCSPTASAVAAGACAPGFVCTGFAVFVSMTDTPDSPGCFPYCTMDSQCPTSAPHCNTRQLGQCAMTAAPTTGRVDGSPCNPQATTDPCLGQCYLVSNTVMTQGICGSTIDTKVAASCPDGSGNLTFAAQGGGDNLALCLYESCTTNDDCMRPLLCQMEGSGTLCDYPQDGGTGIPGDGGMIDASTTDASTTDATTTDAATDGGTADTGSATDVPTATDAGTTDAGYDAAG